MLHRRDLATNATGCGRVPLLGVPVFHAQTDWKTAVALSRTVCQHRTTARGSNMGNSSGVNCQRKRKGWRWLIRLRAALPGRVGKRHSGITFHSLQ